MNKRIFTYSSFFSFSMIVLISCTEIIDMEFTTDFERLVVDAQILDGDTLHYVKLSKINLNTDNGIVSPISAAKVIVNDGENDIVFTESDTLKGLYIAPDTFLGKYGTNYSLEISETGVKGTDASDTYLASAIMGNALVIDSVAADYMNIPSLGMLGYMLKCWAQDPPERNFYMFKVWRNNVLLTDTLYEYGQTDDLVYNGTYIEAANCMLLNDLEPDEYLVSGDTLTLEIDNIDKAYFDYLNSAQSEYWGSNPIFGGPPANVYSNVSNGAVGVFRVYSVCRKTMILKEAIRF